MRNGFWNKTENQKLMWHIICTDYKHFGVFEVKIPLLTPKIPFGSPQVCAIGPSTAQMFITNWFPNAALQEPD